MGQQEQIIKINNNTEHTNIVKPGKIYELMSKVMGEIDAIEKDRRNKQGSGYNFRGIDDVYNTMHPILSKHGVFLVPKVLDRVREERRSSKDGVLIYTMLTVKYTFYAPDGSFIEAVCVGEGFDSGDKSSNKAMSSAQKYAILQTFCVPTVEPKDSENDSPRLAPRNYEGERLADAPLEIRPKNNNVNSLKAEVADLIIKLQLKKEDASKMFQELTKKQSSKEWDEFDYNIVIQELKSLLNNGSLK